jgi:hypothetical protein
METKCPSGWKDPPRIVKPVWVEIIRKKDLSDPKTPIHLGISTFAMNVPGGCIVQYAGYGTLVPNVEIIEGEDGWYFSDTSEGRG